MRYTPVFVLLVLASTGSCEDDADPHTLTTCTGWTDNLGNPYTGMCEAACASRPATTGKTCDTTAMLQCAEFTFSGEDGCCIEEQGTIKFYECVP